MYCIDSRAMIFFLHLRVCVLFVFFFKSLHPVLAFLSLTLFLFAFLWFNVFSPTH